MWSRPVISLEHQEERRVFREEPKFFELCPIFLNYVQHFSKGGRKCFQGGLAPPAPPLVTDLMWSKYKYIQSLDVSSGYRNIRHQFHNKNKYNLLSDFIMCYAIHNQVSSKTFAQSSTGIPGLFCFDFDV